MSLRKEKDLVDSTTSGDKAKDWVCGTSKVRATHAIYQIYHAQYCREAMYAMAEFMSYVGNESELRPKVTLESEGRYRFAIVDDNQDEIVTLNKDLTWINLPTTPTVIVSPPVSFPDERTSLLEEHTASGHNLPRVKVSSTAERSPRVENSMTKHWLKSLQDDAYQAPGAKYTFEQIRNMEPDVLDRNKSYFQLLFPTSQKHESKGKGALLTKPMAVEIQESEHLQQCVAARLDFMLDFWGLKREGNRVSITDEVKAQSRWEKATYDHNMDRICQTVQFLKQVGFEDCAMSLHDVLTEYLPVNAARGRDKSKLEKVTLTLRQKLDAQNLGYRVVSL
ncbi:opioid growth factor receptor-related protein [Parashewanella tropica]|uniref:opioid growth factor receptor-related protein n=1 Tax=Parashewanella tropica TaxID=2547970 RepID=UPI00147882F3|nr:opioid growth factor receptor-related protein [Parashewanella tropica]